MTENMSWADLGLGDLDLGEVEAAEGFVDEVKDGVFEAVTKPLALGRNEKDGKVWARLDYEIATGEKAGKTFGEMFYDLGDPDAMSRRFLKARLLSLGLPEGFRGMPDPETFANIPVVVTRKATRSKKPGDDRIFYNVTDLVLYNESEQFEKKDAEAAAVAGANEAFDSDLSTFFK